MLLFLYFRDCYFVFILLFYLFSNTFRLREMLHKLTLWYGQWNDLCWMIISVCATSFSYGLFFSSYFDYLYVSCCVLFYVCYAFPFFAVLFISALLYDGERM